MRQLTHRQHRHVLGKDPRTNIMKARVSISFGIDTEIVRAHDKSTASGALSGADLLQSSESQTNVLAILDLFHRYAIRSTWFVNTRSIELLPIHEVVIRGHEIAVRIPDASEASLEADWMSENIASVIRLSGRAPVGFTEPTIAATPTARGAWRTYAFMYSFSRRYGYYSCAEIRSSERWHLVDAKAGHPWRRDVHRNLETAVMTIPANWCLDELSSAHEFKHSGDHHGTRDIADIIKVWQSQIAYLGDSGSEANITFWVKLSVLRHLEPLLMLERFVERVRTGNSAQFKTLEQVAKS